MPADILNNLSFWGGIFLLIMMGLALLHTLHIYEKSDLKKRRNQRANETAARVRARKEMLYKLQSEMPPKHMRDKIIADLHRADRAAKRAARSPKTLDMPS
jgi:hypothetical protein